MPATDAVLGIQHTPATPHYSQTPACGSDTPYTWAPWSPARAAPQSQHRGCCIGKASCGPCRCSAPLPCLTSPCLALYACPALPGDSVSLSAITLGTRLLVVGRGDDEWVTGGTLCMKSAAIHTHLEGSPRLPWVTSAVPPHHVSVSGPWSAEMPIPPNQILF